MIAVQIQLDSITPNLIPYCTCCSMEILLQEEVGAPSSCSATASSAPDFKSLLCLENQPYVLRDVFWLMSSKNISDRFIFHQDKRAIEKDY